MKILLAADGSVYTRHAVKFLIRNRGMFGTKLELCLLHVRPPLPGRATAVLARSAVNRYYSDETRKALSAAKRTLDRKRIPYKEMHLIGDPGPAIAGYARKGRFSVVIMGSHGESALRNLVLGSVASKVLANCRVPVLIVR